MDTDAAKFRQLNRPPINFEVPCKSESVACSSLSLEAWKPKPSPAALPSSRRNKRIEGVLEVPERLLVNALGVRRPPHRVVLRIFFQRFHRRCISDAFGVDSEPPARRFSSESIS